MVERLAARFGTTPMRLLLGGWGLAAVLLLGGLALVLTNTSALVGFVLFIVGVVLTMVVATNLLRLRAGDHARKQSK
jgi:pilus assembly protein TadC